MRRMTTALGLAVLVLATPAGPAPAQTKPPAAAAKPADAAFDLAKTAADALGPEATAAVQRDLIWTGDLNSLASGEFGKRSFDAIRAFQKRIKAKDTGILLPTERDQLAKAAERAAAAYGFKPVTAQGITVGYPAKLVTQKTATEHGVKYSTPTGNITVDILRYAATEEAFEPLFTRLKTERAGRKITYSLLRPDFFVIAGTVDGKSFYMRFLKTDEDSRGFVLGWDPTLSPGFDRVSIAMAGSLAPAGAAPAAGVPASGTPVAAAEPPAPAKPAGPPVPLPAGAPSAPKSGIGFLVSVRGDVLTSAALVAGCRTVTAGGASAPVVAGDAANGPALVRLAAPPKAAPLPLRLAALGVGDAVELVGPAGRSATTVAALAGPGDDTRRLTLAAPGAGGVFDAKGALAGLVAGDAGPVALKALFVSAFLRANGVALAASEGGDPAAAAVPLTCTPGS